MLEKGDVTVNDIQKCEFEMLVAIDKVCRENKIVYMLSSGTLLGAIRHKGFIPWDDDIDIMMTIDNYKKFLKIGQKALGDKFFVQTTYTDYWYRTYAKVRMNGTTAIEKDFINCKMHQGIWIDIFPIIGVKNDPKWLKCMNVAAQFRKAIVSDEYVTGELRNKNHEISLKAKLIMKLPRKIRLAIAKIIDNITMPKYGKYDSANYLWSDGTIFPKFSNDLFINTVLVDFEGVKFFAPAKYDQYLKLEYGDYMTLPPEGKRNSGHTLLYVDIKKDYKEYISKK